MNIATLLSQKKTKNGHKSRSFWSEMRPGGPYFRLGDQEKIFSLIPKHEMRFGTLAQNSKNDRFHDL